LNAITHELVLITNDTYINAESVCELLRKIALLKVIIPHIDTNSHFLNV
jgi:hypothetical protein